MPTVNLRLQASARDLIDRAAEAIGKSRTEFMVEAARREAEAVCWIAVSLRWATKPSPRLPPPWIKNQRDNPRLRRLFAQRLPGIESGANARRSLAPASCGRPSQFTRPTT